MGTQPLRFAVSLPLLLISDNPNAGLPNVRIGSELASRHRQGADIANRGSGRKIDVGPPPWQLSSRETGGRL
jgi:hypothetical protein